MKVVCFATAFFVLPLVGGQQWCNHADDCNYGACYMNPPSWWGCSGVNYYEGSTFMDVKTVMTNIWPWPNICWKRDWYSWIYQVCQPKPCPSSCSDGSYILNYYQENPTFYNCYCASCPTGSYCTGSAKNWCPAGTFSSNSGSSTCLECSAGNYGNSTGQSSCFSCPVGMYGNSSGQTSQSSCISCPVGKYGNSTNQKYENSCISCPLGKYGNSAGQSLCLPCPPGYACMNSTTMTECVNGSTYSLGNAGSCTSCTTTCPAGTFQSSFCTTTQNTQCPQCTNLVLNAYYIGVGITSTDCPWSCNQGYYLSGEQCLSCVNNSWCSGNILNFCPTNTISPALSTSQNQCLCKAGYYGNGSLNGTSPCQICIVGSYCPGGNNNISYSCPVNFTSNEGSSQLSDCYCKPGYQLIANECKLCPPSTFCISGIRNNCPSNSFSPSGSSANFSCMCNPGFYGSNGSNCSQCPANSFCTGGNSIVLCTTNAVSPVQSTNASACYCDRGYQGVSNAACFPCPAGTWCWTGVLNLCPTNSSSLPLSSYWYNCTCMPGFTGIDGFACAPCPPGTYKEYNGSDACLVCPLNSTCTQGTKTPVPCPVGQYYCNGFSVFNCSPKCLNGTYELYSCTASQNRMCRTCPTGSYSFGNQNTCTNCAVCTAGTYQISPCTVFANTQCLPCPAGTFSNKSNSSICFVCEKNTFCPEGSTQGTPCPENSNSLSGSYNFSSCTANDGYYGPVGGLFFSYGSTNINHCSANSGFFGSNGQNITQCYANYYCPAGSTAPIPCPNNFISLPGSSTLSDCTVFDCPPGLYLLQTSCVLCPSNNYCPLSSKQPTPCKTCDHVFLSKCDGTGLINDTTTCACNPGFYLSDPNSNNSQCSACPLYTTSAANNTDTTVLSCTCLAGYTCKYTKRIQGLIKLNMTLSDFNSNAQSALIQAIAQAAGVDVSQVSIVSISSGSSNRRLLGTLAEENTLTVIVRINDSQNAHIRKMSKFSVVAHENPSASSSSESTEKEEQGESSSWQLLRAFSHHAHASEQKMITHHFDILSEVWTPSHSIQVSKL
jgi:hypothetical protein